MSNKAPNILIIINWREVFLSIEMFLRIPSFCELWVLEQLSLLPQRHLLLHLKTVDCRRSEVSFVGHFVSVLHEGVNLLVLSVSFLINSRPHLYL